MSLWLITFSKIYFDACFSAQIVALEQTRHLRPFSGSVRKNLFLFLILLSRVRFIKYDEYKANLALYGDEVRILIFYDLAEL